MKTQRGLWGLFIGVVLQASPSLAQQMSCGSTGADGALVVPSGVTTLDIPDDGVFNFTTIRVSGNLQFNRNTRFNPPVTFLATGDVIFDGLGSAIISLSGSHGSSFTGGLGGPGAFDGGAPGIAGAEPGAGHGPGAGGAGIGALQAGNAAYGGRASTTHTTDGAVYGSPLLIPLAGGSGGGGETSSGGGGGGGAILICSPTRVALNGSIDVTGGGGSGSGSGGAIRIVAPTVSGPGSLHAGGSGNAGHGRVRIDVIDRSGLGNVSVQPSDALAVGSFMAVSAGPAPRLHIVRVAGNDIPPGTPSPLVIMLPFNSGPNHSITVRGEGFTGTVPVAVAVTPESGNPTVINTEIDAALSPAEVTVNVDLPQNIAVRVHAWTR